MQLLLACAAFILGMLCASFAGVIAARLSTGQGFFTGRSACDACGKPLSALALVPVLSYFVMGGKALCCGARTSVIAPLFELILGALFAASYLRFGAIPALVPLFFALTMLSSLVLYDLAHQILPPLLLGLFVLAALATRLLLAQSQTAFGNAVFAALLCALFFAVIYFLSQGRAMGFSDAPLAFGLAVLAGPYALFGMFLSFWIGAGVGIIMLVKRPPGSRMGIEVPFAPFLAAGFLLSFLTQWDPLLFAALLLSSK